MTQTEHRTERASTFDSLNPTTGDVVGTHPVHTESDVHQTVARAREAAAWWSALSFDERDQHLSTWKGVITRRVAQLADVMHQETGKPHADAMLEAALAIDLVLGIARFGEHLSQQRQQPREAAGEDRTCEGQAVGVGAGPEHAAQGLQGDRDLRCGLLRRTGQQGVRQQGRDRKRHG